MSELNLNPTPRGWLEKAYDSNVLFMLPLGVLVAAQGPLSEKVGYWPAVAISILFSAALSILISLPVVPLRRRRAALDAEKGLFECAHRERGSSLRGRWAVGYAKAEPGSLLFQAKTGVSGSPAGRIEIYSGPRVIGKPEKAPWSVFPRGQVITLSTDRGTVELAASPSSLQLLAERCLNNSENPM